MALPVSDKPSLLLIGDTKTGKTHYGGQLLRRLQAGHGKLRMVGVPTDISVFETACKCLAQGKTAPHTSSTFGTSYRESIWPIANANGSDSAELVWPDYAGEQIGEITNHRQIPEAWQQRIKASSGWIIFIRPILIKPPDDVLSRPTSVKNMETSSRTGRRHVELDDTTVETDPQNPDSGSLDRFDNRRFQDPAAALSDQARFIELMQALLFSKQIDSVRPHIAPPPLTVVLSCWDELPASGSRTPRQVMENRLPLFVSYLDANWCMSSLDIYGMSALGKALDSENADEAFMEGGPEAQGWCVLPDGTQTTDLTWPVACLLARTNNK